MSLIICAYLTIILFVIMFNFSFLSERPWWITIGTNVGADHMLGQLIKPTRDDKHGKVDLRPLCNSNDPASSVDTSISHNESTYPPKATGASDVIADKNIKGKMIVLFPYSFAVMLFLPFAFERNPRKTSVDNLNDSTENTQVTEEERKRDRKKALRRAAYRQRKDRNLQDEHAQALILSANPTSSNYTSFSVDATTFQATTTVTSGLINDMEVQDVVLNNTQETKQKTDEELKRDRRNALRRAAYRRKKDKLIHDENIRPLSLSANPNSSSYIEFEGDAATFPHSTLDASVVTHDNDLARRQRDNERKRNLTNVQREQINAQRRADYQRNKDKVSVDVRETVNEKVREKRMQRRKSMSVIEKGESSAQRKANYARRKNTPCNESIALPRPDLANSTSECPTLICRASSVSRVAEDDSSDGDPPTNKTNYIVGIEGMKLLMSLSSAHYQQPSSNMMLSTVTFATTNVQRTSNFYKAASWAMSRQQPN
nr:uncharacterized protein LOC120966161 isoform X1 [Aegilops tauschii subsp. strangulata]